jgi:hypothetical protein
MKKILIILSFVVCVNISFATNYFFTGNEDNDFKNAANWSPSFPGTHIQAGDMVFIQSDVYLEGVSWEVSGVLDISMGVTLYSRDNGIHVLSGGKLVNNGEIQLATLENKGRIENGMKSVLSITKFTNQLGATLHNYLHGTIHIETLVNDAEFISNGTCSVKNCINKSTILLSDKSDLAIEGTLENFANSTIQKGGNATLTIGKTIDHKEGYLDAMN